MPRITETFTISLPPEMAVELERIRKEEHRTRSELIREALRHYVRIRTVQGGDETGTHLAQDKGRQDAAGQVKNE